MNIISDDVLNPLSVVGTQAGVPTQEGLSKRTARGAMWLGGVRAWTQLMNLTVGVALARLLDPGDYGLLGMVMVVTGLFSMLSDLGLSTAVIQKQRLTHEALSTVFWLNLGLAATISGLLMAASPLAATFFSQPKVAGVMCVLVLVFPISALSSVQYALVQKAMRFSVVTKIHVVSSLVAGLLAIAAAIAGWGVWALVLQTLCASAFGGIGLWVQTKWYPSFHFAWNDLKGILGFGINLTAFSFVNYFARSGDNFLVGRFLGASQLGLYNLAYTLMVFPVSNLTSVMQGALVPAMSQVQNEAHRISNAYIRTCRYLSFLILPAMVGLALLAREAVVTIYGSKWDGAGRVLQVLAWVGTWQPFDSLTGTLFVSRGLTRWLFWTGFISAIVTVIGFVIGLRWGIIGVAWSYLISQAALALGVLPIQYRKTNVSMSKLFKGISIPLVASVFMGAVVITLKLTLKSQGNLTPVRVLAICIPAGIISYCLVLLILQKYFWKEFRAEFKRIFEKG